MKISSYRWDDAPKYCSYCGEELDIKLEKSWNSSSVFVHVSCPNRKGGRFQIFWELLSPTFHLHTHYFVGIEDPVYLYDPMTGEKTNG